jgi:excisionase family DNA binding protein
VKLGITLITLWTTSYWNPSEPSYGKRLGSKAESELLGPEELAERLKVPISWVYENSRQGRIPCVRIGRYVRFRLDDVLKSQRKEN